MAVVFISAALILVSIGYLARAIIKTKKEMNGPLSAISSSASSLQGEINEVKKETSLLSSAQHNIREDVEQKKKTITHSIAACKEFRVTLKELKNTNKPGTMILSHFKKPK